MMHLEGAATGAGDGSAAMTALLLVASIRPRRGVYFIDKKLARHGATAAYGAGSAARCHVYRYGSSLDISHGMPISRLGQLFGQ